MSEEDHSQFEDLRVWQEARTLSAEVYRLFGNGTKAERDFGFRDQIQRASVSVMNNIAEGFERDTSADFARFLGYAKGSSGETRSMLYLAEDLEYLGPDFATDLRRRYTGLSKGIAAFTASVRNRP